MDVFETCLVLTNIFLAAALVFGSIFLGRVLSGQDQWHDEEDE